MSQPVPEDPEGRPPAPKSKAFTAALEQLCSLWHYLPDYDYRPDLFVYAEFHTTDPDYVVVDVGDMFPPGDFQHLSQIQNALAICLASFCDHPAPPQVVRRIDIAGIPERMFASRRRTSVLTPDVAVWACLPSTPPPHDSYWYDRDGAPGLVLEVVTPGTSQARAHDMAPRQIAYARMGVREFWLLDTRQDFPLMGFTLDAKDGDDAPLEAYRPLAVGPGGGQHSRVLGTSLRWVAEQHSRVLGTSRHWVADTLECWHGAWECWFPVLEIPIREAEARGLEQGLARADAEEQLVREYTEWGSWGYGLEVPIIEAEARGRKWGRSMADVAGNLDLLLGLGVPPDIALEMGLDLWLMDIMPGAGALLRTQGNLEQLRRHIPVQPRGQGTAGLESQKHMSTLLQACPSFPAPLTPDQEMEQDYLLAEMRAAWNHVRAEGLAEGLAKGLAQGLAQERRLMLLKQAAPHLTRAALSRCSAALKQMDLAALPAVKEVDRVLSQGRDVERKLERLLTLMEQDNVLAEMEAAWDHVRAEGLAQGLAEGLAEGLAKGLAEGLAESLAEGLAKGRAKERRRMLLKQAAPHLTAAALSRCSAALEQMDLATLPTVIEADRVLAQGGYVPRKLERLLTQMDQDYLLAERDAAWDVVWDENYAIGLAEGRAEERRRMLLKLAAPHLTAAVLSRCSAALEQMDLAALPAVIEVVRVLSQGGDVARKLERLLTL